MSTPKIYAFINGPAFMGDLSVVAIAEDGTGLAGHVSSCEGWAKHDIGIGSTWKHEKYRAHYPDGYELVWVDDPSKDDGCTAAIKIGNERCSTQDQPDKREEQK